MMQVTPLVVVITMVHVPVFDVNTSNIALPDDDRPRARGDSLYLSLSALSSAVRSPQAIPAACACVDIAITPESKVIPSNVLKILCFDLNMFIPFPAA